MDLDTIHAAVIHEKIGMTWCTVFWSYQHTCHKSLRHSAQWAAVYLQILPRCMPRKPFHNNPEACSLMSPVRRGLRRPGCPPSDFHSKASPSQPVAIPGPHCVGSVSAQTGMFSRVCHLACGPPVVVVASSVSVLCVVTERDALTAIQIKQQRDNCQYRMAVWCVEVETPAQQVKFPAFQIIIVSAQMEVLSLISIHTVRNSCNVLLTPNTCLAIKIVLGSHEGTKAPEDTVRSYRMFLYCKLTKNQGGNGTW